MSNTKPETADQTMPEWYDPYPEPNTMPRKWDLSQYGYAQSEAPKQAPVEKKDTPAA